MIDIMMEIMVDIIMMEIKMEIDMSITKNNMKMMVPPIKTLCLQIKASQR